MSLVGIGVIDHESSPLGHLAEMTVGVVEILHCGQICLRGQACWNFLINNYIIARFKPEWELKSLLVTKYAGKYGNVA